MDLISINSSHSISLNLNSWKSFCKINYFSVKYKEYNQQNEWTIVSNNVSPDLEVLTINDLKVLLNVYKIIKFIN